jgi:UDP-N-acetylglucosamine 1-carboxyvinyltransferase
VIENAALEPEVVDLAGLLLAMGAKVRGAGTPTITIVGVERLHGADYAVIPDRIEAGTFLLAAAITRSTLTVGPVITDHLGAVLTKLEEAGCKLSIDGTLVTISAEEIRAVDLRTQPFPGFPTDLQAQMMAMLCTAEGTSVLEEKIFENRFMHAPELTRMGAKIEVHGGTATVTGVKKLKGARVMATDLRASVSLILAALAAEGETVVSRVYHLDRGYERVEEKLRACGAQIERITG